MSLNPEIWGPKYWFVLHTIALKYPKHPNDVTKKKYYEFIQNIPLFLPNEKIGNEFINILDKYPVTPYLDSRPSFMKWMNFIHNIINKKLNKPEMTLQDSLDAYYELYKPKELIREAKMKERKKYIYASVIIASIIGIYFLYNSEH